jgi:integrase/recombinase XerD
MVDRRFDPARRCMPAAEWPARDSAAWNAVFRKGSILDGSGPGADWAPPTRTIREKAYGRCLTYLHSAHLLDPALGPLDRVSPDYMEAYIRHLQNQVASSTVWSYFDHLCAAVQAMVPDADWRWLREVVNRLYAMATPARPVAPRLIPLPRRVRAGYKLMKQADDGTAPPHLRAGRYRDGLMLVLQSHRALRLTNLTLIRVGKQLVRMSEGYWLRFEAKEMKARRPFELPVPEELNACIERYLTVWRPPLLKGGTTDALWLTKAGRPMRTYSVHSRVTKLTKRLFGKVMSTHLFRHGLGSHVAETDPEHVRMITPLLSQKQFSTTDRYYIKAQSLKASRAQNTHLQELRSELRGYEVKPGAAPRKLK